MDKLQLCVFTLMLVIWAVEAGRGGHCPRGCKGTRGLPGPPGPPGAPGILGPPGLGSSGRGRYHQGISAPAPPPARRHRRDVDNFSHHDYNQQKWDGLMPYNPKGYTPNGPGLPGLSGNDGNPGEKGPTGPKGAKGERGDGGAGNNVLILENVSALEQIDLEEGSFVYTRKSDELWFRTPAGWRQVKLGRKL